MNILELRLYKVPKKDISYNQDRTVKSENQLYKVSHNTFDWESFKKTIKYSFKHAEIVSYKEQVKTIEQEDVLGKQTPVAKFSYKDLEITNELKQELDLIFTPAKEALTADQKEIAELKAQMAELLKSKAPKQPVKEKKESDPRLEELRAEYTELYEKKPNHLMKVAGLEKAINEFKSAE